MRLSLGRLAALVAAVALFTGGSLRADEPVTVFGAASLTDALQAVAQVWTATSGVEVRFSFASSSALARQIEAGAPADIYVSANLAWMDHVEQRGLVEPGSRREPVANALVVITSGGFGIAPIEDVAAVDLASYLGADGRIALGDPDHVPAGIYARQSLETLGQWPALAERLARTDNVRGALALVERGETPLGIVYATDALIDPRVRVIGRLPADSHDPIAYAFAIVAGHARPAVEELYAFMTSPEGIAIFTGYGFLAR